MSVKDPYINKGIGRAITQTGKEFKKLIKNLNMSSLIGLLGKKIL